VTTCSARHLRCGHPWCASPSTWPVPQACRAGRRRSTPLTSGSWPGTPRSPAGGPTCAAGVPRSRRTRSQPSGSVPPTRAPTGADSGGPTRPAGLPARPAHWPTAAGRVVARRGLPRLGEREPAPSPVRPVGPDLRDRRHRRLGRLCAQFPLEVTALKRHDWYRTTGRDGSWVIPDWSQVAHDYDGVHLSIAGYLTAATTHTFAVDHRSCVSPICTGCIGVLGGALGRGGRSEAGQQVAVGDRDWRGPRAGVALGVGLAGGRAVDSGGEGPLVVRPTQKEAISKPGSSPMPRVRAELSYEVDGEDPPGAPH